MFNKTRRGTSIAAAALTAALIVPAVAPVANAQTSDTSQSATSTTTQASTQVEVNLADVLKGANVTLPADTTYTVKSGDIEIKDGKVIVKDASKGSAKAAIVATQPNGVTRTINVTIDKPGTDSVKINANVDNSTCLAAGLGFGLPLLALIPLSIAAQFSMPVLAGITEFYNQQIRNLNTEIQRQAGLLNPELAKQVEQIDRTLHAFGWSLGNAAAALAAGVGTAAAVAGIVYYCSPEVFVKAEVKTTTKPADEKKAEEKKAEEKKADEKKADEKKADEKKADEKKADEKKADEKLADEKKADEKLADEKKADEKPADEKKADEKPADEKKADEKKADEKKAEETK